ncbi:MAG TPA: glycosyltransferase family 39 protein, partial [Polyangiales bacterium]|nr:glycosyltransferase family 39 protein [Polyangiales bacterium]
GKPDHALFEHGAASLYGGLVDLLSALLSRVLPWPRVEAGHLVDALFGWAGCIGVWRLARELGGPRAGLIALLLIATTPAYYGHMFANPKDVPFAATYAFSLYYLAVAMRRFPDVPASLALRLGVAIGLSFAIRVGAFLLIAYAGLGFALVLLARHALIAAPWTAGLRQLVRPALIAGATSYALMWAFWPLAQQGLLAPLAALRSMSSFDKGTEHFLFQGELFTADQMPARYLPTYLSVTTPEPVLLLLVAALIATALRLRARAQLAPSPGAASSTGPERLAGAIRACQLALLAASVVLPIAYIIVRGAPVFNGLRHVLFVVPPLIVGAALSADWWLGPLSVRARRLGYALVAAGVLWNAASIVALHPYQYMYFNSLAGGLRGALGFYETDYWSASYREAVLALRNKLAASDPAFARTTYRIWSGDPPLASIYYFPRNFQWVRHPALADFTIANVRHNLHLMMSGQVFATVSRQGATIAYVHDRRMFPRLDPSAAPGKPAASSR